MESGLISRTLGCALLVLGMSVRAEPAPPDDVAARVDTLFAVAVTGEWRYAEMREAAWDSLVALGAPASAQLVAYLGTDHARERFTLREILATIGPPAVPYLVPVLADTGRRAPRLAARILGRIAAPEALGEFA